MAGRHSAVAHCAVNVRSDTSIVSDFRLTSRSKQLNSGAIFVGLSRTNFVAPLNWFSNALFTSKRSAESGGKKANTMTPKRRYKRGAGSGVSNPPSPNESHVTTRAELIAKLGSARHAAGPKPKKRVDSRRDRKRDHSDGIDDFELELWRHGVNFADLYKAAVAYSNGTQTQYNKLANAIVRWWCSLPMGPRKIVWVDSTSGYTERTVPKFSTALGRQLVDQGLAGARWVYSRSELLKARQWRQRMLEMTPAQRLRLPAELGTETIDWNKFEPN